MFSIIKFRNDICNVSDDVHGVCYTTGECSDRGGQPRTSCAAGFGTCCVCERERHRWRILRDPAYPYILCHM